MLFFFLETIATADPLVAFKDVDAAILVGAMPRREGMERKDLLKANVKIFKEQGKALDTVAKKTVKVCSSDLTHFNKQQIFRLFQIETNCRRSFKVENKYHIHVG